MKKYILLIVVILIAIQTIRAQVEDPYLWLEDVDGARSMEFVKQQNKITLDKLSNEKEYQNIFSKSLEIYNSPDRIVYPTLYGEYVYNFWQDKEHERGIWRRTTKAGYISGNPVWDILLDLDEMAKKDNIKWVYKSAEGLYPRYDRFLIGLSKGGGDAVITKEFDVNRKSFMENGFYLDEAKGGAVYQDENTLIVSTDFGKGTLTTSGYPRQVKIWKKGTLIKDAQLLFEGDTTDVASWAALLKDGDTKYVLVIRAISFYTNEFFVLVNNKLIKLDIPDDSQPSTVIKNQLVLSLKSDWNVDGKTYKQGSLVSLDFTSLLKGKKEMKVILDLEDLQSVSTISNTKNKLLVNLLKNVKNELYVYSFNEGKWGKVKVNTPDFGTIEIKGTDEFSDQYFFSFSNFITPTTLYFANAGDNSSTPYKSLPAYFDGSKYKVEQYKAKSKDGTMVPYFVIAAKGMKYNSSNPTLLYAYGGFEVSEVPFYSGTIGNAWLNHGGVFILANIRGGGEFGPKWHQAGLKEKRQNIYDDFHSVAEDLIAKKITSNKNLGIMGGSNGGLLVGVAFTQRPDLYQAVVCQVPLLDMRRYNKLLAGASWMGEFGDPDKPEEWEYIKKYSPYQNLKKDAKYPEVLFTTSTRDDRVHPGHARKMVAKMIDMGHPVYYYENVEGGHAGSSTNEQWAKEAALEYSYLLMKLKN